MIMLFRCWVESGWKNCVFSSTAPGLGTGPIPPPPQPAFQSQVLEGEDKNLGKEAPGRMD